MSTKLRSAQYFAVGRPFFPGKVGGKIAIEDLLETAEGVGLGMGASEELTLVETLAVVEEEFCNLGYFSDISGIAHVGITPYLCSRKQNEGNMKKVKTAIMAAMLVSAMNTAAQSYKMEINVNGHTMTATMADNSSAAALREILEQGVLTVSMHDYGNFEKEGSLGHTLPRNDESITTTPGDIILYQGNQITIYYDINTWSFTRLGHIDDITQNELKNILGNGNVTVTFSLPNSTGISSVSTDGDAVSSEVFTLDGRKVGSFNGEVKNLSKGCYVVRKKFDNDEVITIKQIVK